MAEDSGVYACQVILTINDIDTFTASDTSEVFIRGEHALEQFIFLYLHCVYIITVPFIIVDANFSEF